MKHRITLPLLLLALLLPLAVRAAAPVYTVLANFGTAPDGHNPAGLVLASDGNFYGTTAQGGTSGGGTIFRLTNTGSLTTLYSFTGAADGAAPVGSLVAVGNTLYGTTNAGGANNNGTFFKISTTGSFTALHSFNSTVDGNAPLQIYLGGDNNFYALSTRIVSNTLVGIFEQITPAGAITVSHAFTDVEGAFLNPEMVLGPTAPSTAPPSTPSPPRTKAPSSASPPPAATRSSPRSPAPTSPSSPPSAPTATSTASMSRPKPSSR